MTSTRDPATFRCLYSVPSGCHIARRNDRHGGERTSPRTGWERPMKITIFAATGGIGRQLLEQATAAGHDVTAVARNPRILPAVAAGVVPAALAAAAPAVLQTTVAGADAVLSALGPRTKAAAGIAARGTEVITEAMRATGVRRIIVVSAAPVGTVPSPDRPY